MFLFGLFMLRFALAGFGLCWFGFVFVGRFGLLACLFVCVWLFVCLCFACLLVCLFVWFGVCVGVNEFWASCSRLLLVSFLLMSGNLQ